MRELWLKVYVGLHINCPFFFKILMKIKSFPQSLNSCVLSGSIIYYLRLFKWEAAERNKTTKLLILPVFCTLNEKMLEIVILRIILLFTYMGLFVFKWRSVGGFFVGEGGHHDLRFIFCTICYETQKKLFFLIFRIPRILKWDL